MYYIIFNILTANKHFFKGEIANFLYSDMLTTVYMFKCCQAFVRMVTMQEIMGFLKKF